MSYSDADYQKVVNSLKKRSKGATAADICALTALPLSAVRELLPKAADEYSGHLRVTQSGEILYHFPRGFISKYRGLGVFIKKAAGKLGVFIKKALAFLFKIWIMVMLIGYFLLFIAIALATVFLSAASKSGGKGGKSGDLGLFDLLIRLWFYSSLTRSNDDYRYPRKAKKDKRPMHKAIFSFIFGEEDPNKDWNTQLNKSIIAFLQFNNGVISLPEYMIYTGENSMEAEQSILSFCSKYSGSPELTEEGTIVYRFDELLLSADAKKYKDLSPGIQRLKTFSSNSKKMNVGFIIINAVNLVFGSYFLYQTLTQGLLTTDLQYQLASKMYAYTHFFLGLFVQYPTVITATALGIVPVLFSIFFWLIPLVRYSLLKKDNEKIKLTNFKRFSFNKIWSALKKIRTDIFSPPGEECRPKDLNAARDRVIKDIGAISSPEVETDEYGETIYSFTELEREKKALNKYRASVDTSKSQIGEIVFDSDA